MRAGAGQMYVVQSRVNGPLVDEERCATFFEAQEAVDRRGRLLPDAGAAIVAEGARQYVVARTADGWVTVAIVDGERPKLCQGR